MLYCLIPIYWGRYLGHTLLYWVITSCRAHRLIWIVVDQTAACKARIIPAVLYFWPQNVKRIDNKIVERNSFYNGGNTHAMSVKELSIESYYLVILLMQYFSKENPILTATCIFSSIETLTSTATQIRNTLIINWWSEKLYGRCTQWNISQV